MMLVKNPSFGQNSIMRKRLRRAFGARNTTLFRASVNHSDARKDDVMSVDGGHETVERFQTVKASIAAPATGLRSQT